MKNKGPRGERRFDEGYGAKKGGETTSSQGGAKPVGCSWTWNGELHQDESKLQKRKILLSLSGKDYK